MMPAFSSGVALGATETPKPRRRAAAIRARRSEPSFPQVPKLPRVRREEREALLELVDATLDGGPIVLQEAVDVRPDDDEAARGEVGLQAGDRARVRRVHERDLDPSPVKQIAKWLKEAIDAAHPEPNAMTVATSTTRRVPGAARTCPSGASRRTGSPSRTF